MGEEKHTAPAIRKEWYKGYLIVLTFPKDGTGNLHAAVYTNGEKPKNHVFTYSRFFCTEEEILGLVRSKIDKMKFE